MAQHGISRVSARGLDQRISRLDPACPLGFLNHPERYSVFDTPARIEILQLRIDGGLDPDALRDLAEFDHGCIPNLLRNRVHYSGGNRGGCQGRHAGGLCLDERCW